MNSWELYNDLLKMHNSFQVLNLQICVGIISIYKLKKYAEFKSD